MDPPFDKTRHLRYWQRCLRSLLPQPYTANDSTRMTLGCFAVAAVDLLESGEAGETGEAPPVLSPADRARLRAWVLACQHPAGGFAGGPTHVLPCAAYYDGFAFASPGHDDDEHHHPAGRPAVGARGEANLAATLFALQLLALLSDNNSDSTAAASSFAGVDRTATLRWLRQLQRADGSFGEYVDDVVDGRGGGRRRLVGGGADMRYCYMAAMVRWMLRGGGGGGPGDEPDVGPDAPLWVADIDVDGLVAYIRQGQTYDGGFAESATHESHAGYAFCAVAALSLLQRSTPAADSVLARGIADLPALLRWLSARCFLYRAAEDGDNSDAGSEDDPDAAAWHESIATDVTPADRLRPDAHPLLAFNGRANKHADTCYTWWARATMAILAEAGAMPAVQTDENDPWPACRRFLLEQTQHRIGGFAKTPGGPPDLYHAYLGLAVLALQGEPALPAFDAAVCVSAAAVAKIEAARAGLLRAGAAAGARRAALLRMGRRVAARDA